MPQTLTPSGCMDTVESRRSSLAFRLWVKGCEPLTCTPPFEAPGSGQRSGCPCFWLLQSATQPCGHLSLGHLQLCREMMLTGASSCLMHVMLRLRFHQLYIQAEVQYLVGAEKGCSSLSRRKVLKLDAKLLRIEPTWRPGRRPGRSGAWSDDTTSRNTSGGSSRPTCRSIRICNPTSDDG